MKYLYLDETTSTNNYAKNNISSIEDRTIIYTSKQTQGRGRFNRIWIDLGNENLFLSIILKPSDRICANYSNLTQYTALKLAQTFETYNVSPEIKWPNDILINGKKISGILAEAVTKNNQLSGLIIGVGINLNAKKEDFSKIDKLATALNIETNKKIDKQLFLEKFIENFFTDYENFLSQGFELIKNDYKKYISFLGKEITINNLDTTITGIAEAITEDGAILINGEKYFTGDII